MSGDSKTFPECELGGSTNGVGLERFVVRTRLIGDAAQSIGEWRAFLCGGGGRSKARGPFDGAVPRRRPHSVCVSAARGPTQHGLGEGNSKRDAQLREHAGGIREHVMAFDYRRRGAEALRLALEDLPLLNDTNIRKRHGFALLHV